MIGQVENRRFVGDSTVIDAQFTLVVERVGDRGRQLTRIAFFPVSALVGQLQRHMVGSLYTFGLPVYFVKPLQPTVQMIWAIITSQGVFHLI